MSFRRAVVFYEQEASDAEKISALKAGITDCALELAELGVPFEEIEDACENALSIIGLYF